MNEVTRKRERISPSRKAETIQIIEGWDENAEKLTKAALARRVTAQLGFEVTRQGLMKHPEIKEAFDKRERDIALGQPKAPPKEPLEDRYERRIKELEGTIAKLKSTLSNYDELFLRYRYNARQRGLPRHVLEAPILERETQELE